MRSQESRRMEMPTALGPMPYRKLKDPTNRKNCTGRFRKCAKIENDQEVIVSNEFVEERNNGSKEWNIGVRNLENPGGDYDNVDNHELEEENK